MASGEARSAGRRLTLQLSRGPLTVRPVGANALAFLDSKHELGAFYQRAHHAPGVIQAWMQGLSEERQAQINDGLDAMLNYCLMWGVVDEPGEEDVELLEAMGFSSHNERVQKLYWLRLVRLEDSEAGAVMFAVRRLTFLQGLEGEGE